MEAKSYYQVGRRLFDSWCDRMRASQFFEVAEIIILGYVVMRATSPSAKEIELVKRVLNLKNPWNFAHIRIQTSQENNAKNYNAIARNNQTIIQTILSSAGAPVEVKEKPPLTTEKLAPTLQERLQG